MSNMENKNQAPLDESGQSLTELLGHPKFKAAMKESSKTIDRISQSFQSMEYSYSFWLTNMTTALLGFYIVFLLTLKGMGVDLAQGQVYLSYMTGISAVAIGMGIRVFHGYSTLKRRVLIFVTVLVLSMREAIERAKGSEIDIPKDEVETSSKSLEEIVGKLSWGWTVTQSLLSFTFLVTVLWLISKYLFF